MITNVIKAPNTFLKCYSSFTIAINNDFTLSGMTVGHLIVIPLNKGSMPYDILFSNDVTVHSEANYTALPSPNYPNDRAFLNSTKKAVFKINEHTSVPSQDYIANYTLDGNIRTNPTGLGTGVLPINALAKDGDEFEIYGFNEIKKVHFGQLDLSMNPVPFLLTISLFK
jgi:hypothetical protein